MDEYTEARFRGLFARIMATGTMVEVLMFAYLSDKPPEVAQIMLRTIRNTGQDIGPAGTMSDIAAEFMADVRVQTDQSLEHMARRVEDMLIGQGVLDPASLPTRRDPGAEG